MTREETMRKAIEHFKYGVSHDIFNEPVTSYARLAIEALEALQERPKGRWEYEDVDYFRCSVCESYEVDKTFFCPNCGADCRESEE